LTGVQILGSLHTAQTSSSEEVLTEMIHNVHQMVIVNIIKPIISELQDHSQRNLKKQNILKTSFWCLSNIFGTRHFCDEFLKEDDRGAINELISFIYILSQKVESILL